MPASDSLKSSPRSSFSCFIVRARASCNAPFTSVVLMAPHRLCTVAFRESGEGPAAATAFPARTGGGAEAAGGAFAGLCCSGIGCCCAMGVGGADDVCEGGCIGDAVCEGSGAAFGGAFDGAFDGGCIGGGFAVGSVARSGGRNGGALKTTGGDLGMPRAGVAGSGSGGGRGMEAGGCFTCGPPFGVAVVVAGCSCCGSPAGMGSPPAAGWDGLPFGPQVDAGLALGVEPDKQKGYNFSCKRCC